MPIELEGIDEFIRNLERIGKRIEDVAPKALAAGAEVIRREAAKRAPYDTTSRNLAKRYSPGRHLRDNIATSDMKRSADGELYVEVGPQRGDNNDFFYGKFLEFGTVKMPSQPFVEPAFLEKRKECLDIIAGVVRQEVERGV